MDLAVVILTIFWVTALGYFLVWGVGLWKNWEFVYERKWYVNRFTIAGTASFILIAVLYSCAYLYLGGQPEDY